MKKFDFEHPDFIKGSGIHRQKFYRENYNKPITEDQFVKEVASWPKRSRHNSHTRKPSIARLQYRRLVKNFGFFKGGQK